MKKYKISFEEYYAATKLFLGWKIWTNRIIFLVIIYLAVLSILLITGNLLYNDLTNINYLLVLFIISLIILIPLSVYQFGRRCRMIYDSTKSIQTTYQIKFNDKHIELESKYGKNIYPWNEMYGYKYNKNFIVMGISMCTIFTLPMRIFENDKEKKELFGYLEKYIKNRKKEK